MADAMGNAGKVGMAGNCEDFGAVNAFGVGFLRSQRFCCQWPERQ